MSTKWGLDQFTDIGLFFGIAPLRELIGIHGTIDPVRCLTITNALTSAFFDQYLKQEAADSLDSLAGQYPERKKMDLD
ncbi:hypothetical protein [Paenibacillus sp. sgz500958]|uniref:hypothetical protein n=1 Tax=Paenibacillus sp. sgz500958 TaxID=3242475 RepID=UPI0036D28C96